MVTYSPKPMMVIDVGSGTININAFVYVNRRWKSIIKGRINARLAKGTTPENPFPLPKNVKIAKRGLEEARPIIKLFQDVRIVGTSALREIQFTEEGKKIIAQLEKASGGRKIHILSGEEEAFYMGRAIITEFSRKLKIKSRENSCGEKKIKKKQARRAFIGIGGGSIQTGVIIDGEVSDLCSIPYGVQTLISESHNNIETCKTLLQDQLPSIPHEIVKELYITGGNWREIAKIITAKSASTGESKKSPKNLILDFEKAHSELTKIISDDFSLPPDADRTKEEIQFGAIALLTAMEKYKATKIIFCNSTMRHGIAEDPELHTRFSSPKLAA